MKKPEAGDTGMHQRNECERNRKQQRPQAPQFGLGLPPPQQPKQNRQPDRTQPQFARRSLARHCGQPMRHRQQTPQQPEQCAGAIDEYLDSGASERGLHRHLRGGVATSEAEDQPQGGDQ